MSLQAILADLRENWALYCAMPVVAALIGYGTKLLAIRMMFQPLRFVGWPPYLGWQGIVPGKARVMAETIYETLTRRLLQPEEIVRRLEPARVAAEIEETLQSAVEEITAEVARRHHPDLWEVTPAPLRAALVRRIQSETPALLREMVVELQTHLTQVFDLKDAIVSTLTADPALLNRIFQQAGREEFRFIRNSGIYFGFAIGCVQAVAWALTHSVWIMPLFGGFVGWFSDWLALRMVFRPREPRRFLGLFTWQGLFLKRRHEVAREYATLIAREVVTARNLFACALRGPASDKLFALIERQVAESIDRQAGLAKPLVVLALGPAQYRALKADVARQLIARLPDAMQDIERYADEAMNIHDTLVSKMQQMTAEEFEGVLRPVFRQDEWKIIAVGAVLGVIVGELQLALMLHL